MDVKHFFSAGIRDLYGSPERVFRMAVVIGTALSVLSLIFTFDIYRDAAGVYAYFARELGAGNFPGGWVGGIPMLQVALAGAFSFAGVEAFRAHIFLSCLCYVLTLFPLRGFLRQFLTPLQAAWGCVLFVTAPKLIRFSVAGLIDAGRYFFMISALYLLFRLKERLSWRDLVLFGLALAGLALSRCEELFFSLLLLAVLPVISLSRQTLPSPEAWKKRLTALLVAGLVFLAGVTPFCAMNLFRYGAFVTDTRIGEALGMVSPRPVFRHPADAAAPSAGETIAVCAGDTLRGGYEPYMAAALLGAVLVIRRRRWDRRHTLLAAIFALHTVVYFKFSYAYRYSIYLVPMLMPLTVAGICGLLELYRRCPLREEVRRWSDGALFLAAAVVLASQVANGMAGVISRKDRGKRALAAYIRQWGERNVPGRRLRLVCTELRETTYWSGAQSVFNYETGERDLRSFRDFDLLVIPESRLPELGDRSGLSELPLPDALSRPDGKERYCLFRTKPELSEKERDRVLP